ncbi:unnamed protein product [Vitrella brassicaformis CCMP3155]|uniref:60S ribosome subunit biogenesis protein NIP7 homolog n=1 Tax=Vitrella brassicaformis (strain CCMP3155) TaxID=1169540 RepID=A0A0G4FIU4_VITBC|nr:unnamed protein product [Vitrella brassicaformis CCMP3155]|mmetsp:Transcript_49625/g.124450  ORF Transcript_49625/g.124450 Transcript_49625/m.124450 type:complete len:181 (+) Transcript_49625:112-654(+)|eukprot:CEM13680.1 unnamed protein product [Vitrella brassicaformis CCMP3155]
MRPLTQEETTAVFEKLAKYIGENVMQLVERPDETYVFRLHKDRVYYCSESLLKMAACVPRKELLSCGTCIGKFTKTHKFRITITALEYLARYAKYKVWVKQGGEQTFVYGNHIVKRHLARITENCPKNTGVVLLSQNDIPLGFGVTARSVAEMRSADPEAIIVFHQADVGEYLRSEGDIL